MDVRIGGLRRCDGIAGESLAKAGEYLTALDIKLAVFTRICSV